MNTIVIQQIVDHWHLGKVTHFKAAPGLFRIKTDKGIFLLVEISNQEWQSERLDTVLEKALPSIDTVERQTEPLFCHVKNYHYAAYKLVKK